MRLAYGGLIKKDEGEEKAAIEVVPIPQRDHRDRLCARKNRMKEKRGRSFVDTRQGSTFNFGQHPEPG